VELRNAAGLEPTRIMENESWVAPEYQLVVDVVCAALTGR
jgi:hypothetical protein